MKLNLSAIAQSVLIALLTASIPAAIGVWADVRALKTELVATRQEMKELRKASDDLRIAVTVLDARGRSRHADREYLKVVPERP